MIDMQLLRPRAPREGGRAGACLRLLPTVREGSNLVTARVSRPAAVLGPRTVAVDGVRATRPAAPVGRTSPIRRGAVTRSGSSGSVRRPGRRAGPAPAGSPSRDRWLRPATTSERTQHVIGPNSRCRLPYNRRQYRTVRSPSGSADPGVGPGVEHRVATRRARPRDVDLRRPDGVDPRPRSTSPPPPDAADGGRDSSGGTPGSCDAPLARPRCAPPAAGPRPSAAASTSRPSGQCGVQCGAQVLRGRAGAVRPSSRYSASLAAPVGAAPTHDSRGCGVNPCECATGIAGPPHGPFERCARRRGGTGTAADRAWRSGCGSAGPWEVPGSPLLRAGRAPCQRVRVPSGSADGPMRVEDQQRVSRRVEPGAACRTTRCCPSAASTRRR